MPNFSRGKSYNQQQVLNRSFNHGTVQRKTGYSQIFNPKNWVSPSAQWEGLKFEMMVQHANWMPKQGAVQIPGLLAAPDKHFPPVIALAPSNPGI